MVVGETLESREIRESMKILRSLALEGKGPPPDLHSSHVRNASTVSGEELVLRWRKWLNCMLRLMKRNGVTCTHRVTDHSRAQQ